MNTSKTKDKYQIAIVPGDGIGKEVMEATIFVLDSLGIDFDYVYGDAGDECLEKTGTALPGETLDIIRNADACLFGAAGETAADVIVKIRQEMKMFANLRPVKAYPNTDSLSDDIDLKDIVGDYKDLKPPFSTKKKYEFPDAIALRQLEAWCIDHNDKCILLAKEPDLKNYQSEYLEYKELTDFVSSLEEFEKMISQEKLKNVFELSKERIEKRIQDWVYEQYGDERGCPATGKLACDQFPVFRHV